MAKVLVPLLLAVAAGVAQSQADSFEAASIKPAVVAAGREGGNRSRIEHTPTSLSMWNVSVSDCVQWAYNLASFQMSDSHVSTDSYDILARTGAPVSVSQLRALLQKLLADRFKLALHRENKILPVFDLVIAKGGAKLPQANPATALHVVETLPRVQHDAFVFHDASMVEFGRMLSQLRGIELPVIDRTGIAGNYDIVLKSAPAVTREGDTSALFALIQEQLGLRLVSSRAPIEVVVIDRAEKPSRN